MVWSQLCGEASREMSEGRWVKVCVCVIAVTMDSADSYVDDSLAQKVLYSYSKIPVNRCCWTAILIVPYRTVELSPNHPPLFFLFSLSHPTSHTCIRVFILSIFFTASLQVASLSRFLCLSACVYFHARFEREIFFLGSIKKKTKKENYEPNGL